jgi:hypothetical protein
MNRPEQQIQKAVALHLRQRGAPGLLWFHVPNGAHVHGRRGRVQGGIQKSMGVLAGVSDIIALHQGKLYALELKAPGGRPTELQLEFIDAVKANGGYGVVADSLNEALLVLEGWGLLRGAMA